jgi:hypothetical protein
MSKEITIVDRGRGPQLSTTRLTVMDVFYYMHRGDDFEFIHQVMPTLTRPEFDVIAAYVREHHEELVEKDRRIDEYQQRCKDELKAKGLYEEIDDSIPMDVWREKFLARILASSPRKNGDHAAH